MVELVRLSVDDERDIEFDCGDADLNEYFFKDSRLAYKELVSVTYAWTESGSTKGFFSVSNDAVKRELLSGTALKRVSRGKRYSTFFFPT